MATFLQYRPAFVHSRTQSNGYIPEPFIELGKTPSFDEPRSDRPSGSVLFASKPFFKIFSLVLILAAFYTVIRGDLIETSWEIPSMDVGWDNSFDRSPEMAFKRPFLEGMETLEFPETELVLHAPGWTVFKNLYQVNKVWVIVTSNATQFPARRMMISTGKDIIHGPIPEQSREPTDEHMLIISPDEAAALLSPSTLTSPSIPPIPQAGTTWVLNDPPQFIAHYYHLIAELFYGSWRTFSALYADRIMPDGRLKSGRKLVEFTDKPARVIFPYTGFSKWREYSGMNGLVMRAVFPDAQFEFEESHLLDRVKTGRSFVYQQVLLADRAAANRGLFSAKTFRTSSEAFGLPDNPYWFSPVRRALLKYIGGVPPSDFASAPSPEKPVVTYVSRQGWGRRMLIPEDHDNLVKVLTEASETDGFEFVVAQMDQLTNEEQIRLAARTTIMMGVHGNGLTHLLWMKPEQRSTVMEFFYPGGFAFDYEFTARGLGIIHYGFWGAQYFTSPDIPPVRYPDGFQGNAIPIDGEAVLEIIRRRLGADEDSDLLDD